MEIGAEEGVDFVRQHRADEGESGADGALGCSQRMCDLFAGFAAINGADE